MKISLNLDKYEPLKGSRIKRVLSAEMPEDLQESFATLANDVNTSLVEAFEKDPHSEELRNCAEFASIDQILNMKYADRVSAAADLGVEEDYFRYLNMLKSVVEEIFGKESTFAVEITSLIMGDDPDVQTSVDLTFAMNSLIARTLRKEVKPSILKTKYFSKITVTYDGHQAIVGEMDFSEKYASMLKKATDAADDVHLVYVLDECPGGFGASLNTAEDAFAALQNAITSAEYVYDAFAALQNAITSAEYAYSAGYDCDSAKTELTIKLDPVKYVPEDVNDEESPYRTIHIHK